MSDNASTATPPQNPAEPPQHDKHPTHSTRSDNQSETKSIARRSFLTGGAIGLGVGGLIGAGASIGVQSLKNAVAPAPGALTSKGTETSLGVGGDRPGFGAESLSCHGTHQAGIATPRAAHVRYIAFDLRPEVDRESVRRLFTVLTDDIEGLTSGEGPLADSEVELAARPARLTITIGVGAGLVNRVDPAKKPVWLDTLPSFSRDQLGNGFDDGDLVVLIQADDTLPIAHAARMITRDIASFATVKWIQQGFFTARGASEETVTPRNLMGQVDGTVNPQLTEEELGQVVWLDEQDGWLSGGTALVLRRIRMELDTWEQVDRPGREFTIGRRLSDGAPLSGGDEKTPADFEARNAIGLKLIPETSHMARARSTDPNERILRSSPNYDDNGESGLLFACFQKNPLNQFVQIQKRLDEADLLNTWVTHIGSAVFAILPGFSPDEIIGQSLFD